MSTSKNIDKLCLAVVALTLVLTVLFMFSGSLGLTATAKPMKYENTLFDSSYVHRIDIVMDDWDSFLDNCENEEYSSCTVVADGKKHANIAIRAKGNTSLSNVKAMGSQRYSFKLEFDHYESGKTLDGLDKLCLNNLIQDNTMMKDYLVYQMMGQFGADSPLCSFVWLTVNGEDWGLYLAVEGVEDSFLARNYGSETGTLYKPDSMSFGGGRGNGRDFAMEDLDFGEGDAARDGQGGSSGMPCSGTPGGTPPEGHVPGMPGGTPPDGNVPGMSGGGAPDGFAPGGGGGMGSDDVKLKYIDDSPDSYPNIFDNAKTDVSAEDQARLIGSLKKLSSYSDLEDVLDMEEVLRYFVVHNFVCNGDSYTGTMIHNYYLHEKGGLLGMIPWDYNLAFGTFQGGTASSAVNAAIDSPVSGGSVDERPMVGWIFSDARYLTRYHELFSQFLAQWCSSGKLESLIAQTAVLLRPYVEKDPTKFCTTEAFDRGVAALSAFVSLRAEAVGRQLEGVDTEVEAESLNLSDMGTMEKGKAGFPGGSAQGSTEDASGFPGGSDDAPGGPSEEGTSPQNPGSSPGRRPAAPGDSGTDPSGNSRRGGGQPGDGTTRQGGPSGRTGEAQKQNLVESKDGAFPGNSTRQEPQTVPVWVMVGVSVLLLAAGLLIAGKKKY